MIAVPGARLLALLVLGGAAFAQEPVRFDPARDLEGFEAAVSSDHPGLYPIRRYQAMRDRALSPEELAKVREEWKKDCEAATKRMEAILADPRELYLYDLEKQLARHPFFSRIDYDVDRSIDGVFFLVERSKPGSVVTGDPRKISAFYGPALERMRTAFEKDFARPLGILRRADYLAYAICILLDKAEYHAFGELSEQRWRLTEAYYDTRLALIVAYGDPSDPDTTPANQRRRVLAEFARALQHAHYTGKADRPQSLWLNLGFASWFAWREGMLDEAADKTAPDPEALADLLRKAQDKEMRDLVLHPLLDLVQVTSTTDIELYAKNRVEATKSGIPEIDDTLRAFYDQAFLWVRFLLEGQGGRYRDSFRKYFVQALAGHGGLDEFCMDFRGIDLKQLDKEFYTDLIAQHELLFPKEKIDRSWLGTLFADRASLPPAPTVGGKPSTKTPAIASSAPLPPLPTAPYAAAAVAVQPTDLDGQHGLALVQVVRGDLDGAKATLEALVPRAAGAPEGPRIQKDLERLEQFRLLRDAYFEHLVKSGEKISGKYRGLEYIAPVLKVEDGWIFLGENPIGLSKIPVSALESFEIARQAGRREEQGNAEPWARFWPYVLVGEKKWELLLKDDSAGSRSLREDSLSFYPEVLKCGAAAVALNEIAAIPEPAGGKWSAKEAEKFLGAVQRLLAANGDLPLVHRKLDALRKAAGNVVLATYVPQDPAKLCHGTWTGSGTGRVTIVYDFTKPEEATDFVRAPGYLASFHEGLAPTAKKEEDSSWIVAGGELAGVGSACYRHFAWLQAPVTVRCDLVFRPSSAKNPEAFTFLVGACDDGQGSYAACLNFGDLQLVDLGEGTVRTLADEKPAQSKRVQKLELRNDGTTVSTYLGGAKRHETPCGKRTNGSVFLWFHSDNPIAIQKLEIEGTLDPSWPDRAKAAAFVVRMAELGFK